MKNLNPPSQPLPRHVAVLGAAGGLGQGLLSVCRDLNIPFTAIVRSRPERITNVPAGSRVAVVANLSDQDALTSALTGADAVITSTGTTATSRDSSAFLSANMPSLVSSMKSAGVNRIVIVNSILAAAPGQPASRALKFFSWVPGKMGIGATEMQAVVDAVGGGALKDLRWTLVRAAVNASGKDVRPAESREYDKTINTLMPVSYRAMARWMIEEAARGKFVGDAPVVSRGKN